MKTNENVIPKKINKAMKVQYTRKNRKLGNKGIRSQK